MPAAALTQEQIDALAREGRAQIAREQGESEKTKTANQRAARNLSALAPYVFRGRKYRVRPMDWEDGLRLMELAAVCEELRGRIDGRRPGSEVSAAVFAVYATTLKEILLIAHKLVRPRFVPRAVWRLYPNRFRYASHQEVFDLLRFCGRCQMISPDQQGAKEGR